MTTVTTATVEDEWKGRRLCVWGGGGRCNGREEVRQKIEFG